MLEKTADLHIHSFYSDGTMSPQEIVDEALARGVGLIAIADHNKLEGSLELDKLCDRFNIHYLSAVELDSLDNGVDVHILGYGIDMQDQEFRDFVQKNRTLLDDISIKLIEKMENDISTITLDDYLSFEYDNKNGGWKALHYFMERGLTKSLIEGFSFYSEYDRSYNCVDFPSVSLVCQYIHKAGGKAVLAHPGILIKETDIDVFKEEVLRIIGLGLDGIECYYPAHTEEVTRVCLEICKENNLIITAGSDCHGAFGKTKVGDMDIPISKLELKDIISFE